MRLTEGQYRVGLDFNPSADARVTDLKQKAAAFIDAVEALPVTIPETGRLKALAMTQAEDAAMWAVKAATKRPRD